MAWRNQQTSTTSGEVSNKFDKFFKKSSKNEDVNNDVNNDDKVKTFVNKRYDRNISFESTEKPPNNYNDQRPNNYNDQRPNNYNDQRPNNYNNDRRPNNYNNDRRPNNYNNDRRPNNYNNDQRPNNYNNDQRPNNYNNDRRRNYDNNYRRRNDDNNERVVNTSYYSVENEINDVEKELNSERYISQKKKEELNEKLSKLKEAKKNEFPELKGPVIPTNVVNSVWGNISGKVKCTEGVEEANKNVRRIASEKKKLEKIIQKNEIYEEHVESDFEGCDFTTDDKCNDGWYDEDDL